MYILLVFCVLDSKKIVFFLFSVNQHDQLKIEIVSRKYFAGITLLKFLLKQPGNFYENTITQPKA